MQKKSPSVWVLWNVSPRLLSRRFWLSEHVFRLLLHFALYRIWVKFKTVLHECWVWEHHLLNSSFNTGFVTAACLFVHVLFWHFCSASVVFRHCKLVSEMSILFHCCTSVLVPPLHCFGSDGSGKSWNQILSCLWICFLWFTLLWLFVVFLCLHMTVIWILMFFFSTFVNGVIDILVGITLALQLDWGSKYS